ncbi:M48 family metallopeptidase [Herbaspirillum rhizosphaerae]|uniref:M48 family metallopeptidase n=1 Tax=Herbaspirillum rhizosphaerae TaxID=346179 RepID=UPI00067AAC21|nr:M48 family metallopeptidase [Herbaspirillum rhizosphaerae]
MTTAVAAFYFDGKTSRRHVVTLEVIDGMARIYGSGQNAGDTDTAPVERVCPIAQLRVSERLSRAARKVTYPDGAYLEIQDQAAFAALLESTSHRDSLVVRMQQNWRATLAAAAALIAVLAVSYLYLLPAASGLIAHSLPVSVEQRIGDGALDFLDKHILAPTALPAAQQAAIAARFTMLTAPMAQMNELPPYEIVFRKSRIGPNAFALPSGQIVLTDEIVTLLNDDDAVMGVLAHELGHLQGRHLMRRLIQSSAIGAAATVLFGDVSAVIANIPTVLLDMKYSRDVEREADDYAIALFKANGMSRQKLAYVFEKLGEKEASGHGVPPYLSSHPASAERVQRILNAP